jgi:hypothetical protein
VVNSDGSGDHSLGWPASTRPGRRTGRRGKRFDYLRAAVAYRGVRGGPSGDHSDRPPNLFNIETEVVRGLEGRKEHYMNQVEELRATSGC